MKIAESRNCEQQNRNDTLNTRLIQQKERWDQMLICILGPVSIVWNDQPYWWLNTFWWNCLIRTCKDFWLKCRVNIADCMVWKDCHNFCDMKSWSVDWKRNLLIWGGLGRKLRCANCMGFYSWLMSWNLVWQLINAQGLLCLLQRTHVWTNILMVLNWNFFLLSLCWSNEIR